MRREQSRIGILIWFIQWSRILFVFISPTCFQRIALPYSVSNAISDKNCFMSGGSEKKQTPFLLNETGKEPFENLFCPKFQVKVCNYCKTANDFSPFTSFMFSAIFFQLFVKCWSPQHINCL